MRKMVAVAVAVLLGGPYLALAQEGSKSDFALGELVRVLDDHTPVPMVDRSHINAGRGVPIEDNRALAQQPTQVQQRTHSVRRAVLLGTAIGAAGGLVVALAIPACGDAAGLGYCGLATVAGLGVGAGIGAAAGFVVAHQGWASRHPVLFGTLAGTVGGFLGGALACPAYPPYNDHYSCSVRGLSYAGLGAGVGAGVGLIVSRGRR
jgi:hypothetical protein